MDILDKYEIAKAKGNYPPPSYTDELADEIKALRAQLSKLQPTSQDVLDAERLQARIDALMFEYCPNEMTQEQIATFEKHQGLAQSAGL